MFKIHIQITAYFQICYPDIGFAWYHLDLRFYTDWLPCKLSIDFASWKAKETAISQLNGSLFNSFLLICPSRQCQGKHEHYINNLAICMTDIWGTSIHIKKGPLLIHCPKELLGQLYLSRAWRPTATFDNSWFRYAS